MATPAHLTSCSEQQPGLPARGLVSLFAGLSRGNAAAVAPTAAAVAAVLPVIVAVVDGERPSALAWVGVAVAVPAIVLSSWVADPGETSRGKFGYGLAAGLGFGGFTSIIGFTDPESNLLPLITSRAATMLAVLLSLASESGSWWGLARCPGAWSWEMPSST